MEDEGIFPSANLAINWAVRRVNTPILEQSNIHDLVRKYRSYDPLPEMSQWDKLAEAALIIKVMTRACTNSELFILAVYYSGGTDEQINALSNHIAKKLGKDRWFVKDQGMAWARERPRHTEKWWMSKYKVEERTIQRWRHSISKLLDDMLKTAFTKAENALWESGHVGPMY